MRESLRAYLKGKGLLLAVAAGAEAEAVARGVGAAARAWREWELVGLAPGVDMVVTGVGKACGAGGVARVLDAARHGAVVSVGIAGGYGGLALGSVVVASACVLADEGVATGAGFQDIGALGFPPVAAGVVIPVDAGLVAALRVGGCVVGPVATVSTCSGSDALALELAARWGAVAEAMEGAAVAVVGARLGVAAGEVRVVSNTTGDRAGQVWRVKGALEGLSGVIGAWVGGA
jgi:futalosine hydrolase